jgi:rhodanese-related sulfurtransferase
MRPRIFISIILLILGLIVAFKPKPHYDSFELTAQELLYETNKKGNFYHVDKLADLLINEDPSITLIDVRDSIQFSKYHFPNAINIPFNKLFTEDNIGYIDQESTKNIFYSNGTSLASKAWVLSKLKGFNNNFILEGGLNEWFDKIIKVKDPGYEASIEDQELFSYRSAVKNYFTGGKLGAGSGSKAKKPRKKIKRTKKKAGGGCG